MMVLNDNHQIIDQINNELKSRHNATIRIINDKLTLSVFDMLKKNLSRVKSIHFIIRDKNYNAPASNEVVREFELDLSTQSDSDVFFNGYDIVQKSNLTYLSKAKNMYEFISRSVNVRKTLPDCLINGNLIIIDDDFMIHGSSSLEISNKKLRNSLTEINFNSMSKDKSQIEAFSRQFEALWHSGKHTVDHKDALLKSLSYIYKEYSPEFLYYFTLNELFGRQLDQTVERFEKDNLNFKDTKIWNALYPFQKDCVLSAIQKLNNYGGCIIADSVGLGKTFEALAVIKYFEKRNDNVLVLTPAKLYENWLSFKGAYKDSFLDEEFNYKIMFHTDLSRYSGDSRSGWDLARFDWSKFDLIVIDESHNFRNRNYREDSYTRYQRLLEEVIRGRQKTKVLLLSATPVNNSLVDLKNQISLITADNDAAFSEYGIKSIADVMRAGSAVINSWSKGPDSGDKERLFENLPGNFYKILEMMTISRSRKHITKYYDNTELGKFPEKLQPCTLTPDIDTEKELLNFIKAYQELELLKLCLYTPMLYIKSEHKELYRKKYQTLHKGKAIFDQADRELTSKTLQMFNLFKRLESSVFSFGETLRRMIERIDGLCEMLEKRQNAEFTEIEFEDDGDTIDYKLDIKVSHLRVNDYLQDLHYDRGILGKLYDNAHTVIDGGRDRKIAELLDILQKKVAKTPYNRGNKKVLVFTAFADTAEYIYNYIEKPMLAAGAFTGMVCGSRAARTNNYTLEQEFNNILKAFAPKARKLSVKEQDQISVLIGTDCISEGQNLQDCDCVINFDIHWNPVRLIQRFGRIDRIGSENEKIMMINFFPNVDLNEYLNLESRIKTKMHAVNIASTGDENLLQPELNDINFRNRQLEKLKVEVIDPDEATDSISLTDLNMNQYIYELAEYVKEHPDVRKVPKGIYSVAGGDSKGVIFCFKHANIHEKPDSDSLLYPYYLVYISDKGEVVYGNGRSRDTLKFFRFMGNNHPKPVMDLVRAFLDETKDTKDMSAYSGLLNKSIRAIQGQEEAHSEHSVFDFGGYKNNFAEDGADDFELVSFLVIK